VLGQQNDLWSVNTDREYHEEMQSKAEVEARRAEEALGAALTRTFLKLDHVAFGTAAGIVTGALLLLATVALVLKGGKAVGPHLGLLVQYFPGYRVSVSGGVLGLFYGFVSGFLLGWGFAVLRNVTVLLSMAIIHRRAKLSFLRRLLEEL
jgi:hypothetical protein